MRNRYSEIYPYIRYVAEYAALRRIAVFRLRSGSIKRFHFS
jgi:hypothetical protein